MLNAASTKSCTKTHDCLLGPKSGGRDDECKQVQNKLADGAMRLRISQNNENSEELEQDAPEERIGIVTIQ
jgi:hypothetical protein